MGKPGTKTNRIFVTGTDTGIGKTVLSLLLMRFLYEQGSTPFYIKLIQTGCKDPLDTDSDARFIYENIPALHDKNPADSVACCFKNPKAPWFAARDEGKSVDTRRLVDFVDRKDASGSVLILEGAGGLFVPVDEKTSMVDLIPMLGASPVLAARAGLGTINHTLLSIEALKARGIAPPGVVFLDTAETPQDMIRENMEAVETFSGIKPAGVIGKIKDFSNIDSEFDHCMARICGSLL